MEYKIDKFSFKEGQKDVSLKLFNDALAFSCWDDLEKWAKENDIEIE